MSFITNLSDRPPFSHGVRLYRFLKHHQNAAFFLGGFLFDTLTIQRIDALADLLIQAAYLIGAGYLLHYQYLSNQGYWTVPRWIAKVWHYNQEALHFLFGGLFSAYVVLYFRSATGARPIVFFILLVVLLVVNEMPQLRRYGYRVRLGLFAFCLVSFFIYLVPIIIGRIGDVIFCVSLLLAAIIIWLILNLWAKRAENPASVKWRLGASPLIILIIVTVLYFTRLIPPVPLSVQFQGIYHHIAKINDHYELKSPKPPFYLFWKKDSRPFIFQQGDQMIFFARVFAPSRFRHSAQVWWEWKKPDGHFTITDRVPLDIVGGRDSGFRGYARKSHYQPGDWRVRVVTEDGRTISQLSFTARPDDDVDEREWIITEM